MKVSHFVYNLDSYSGAAFQAYKLAMVLYEKYNIDSIFLNYTNADDVKESDSFFPVSIIKKRSNSFYKLFSILKSIRKTDIIHLHGFHRLPLVINFFMRKPLLFKSTLDGHDDLESIQRKSPFFFKYIFKNQISANNALTIDIHEKNNKFLNEDKIIIINNGIELTDAPILDKEDMFVCVGAVVPRKNVDKAIMFFINNLETTDKTLYVIGPNNDSIPEFNKEYYEHCCKLAQGHNIEFVGNKSKSDLLSYYRRAKGILFFSEREGMPNVLIEALGCNCFPIVNDNYKVSLEVIGELYPNEGYSDRQRDELESLIEYSVASSLPYKRALHFSIDKSAKAHYDLYRKLIGNIN
ncbi:glycosyltransferase family 4 protein [Serratia fonticola]|uniref:glycosyltransferase family 4 protein n=1 Tax=Serratia fonticola TaxID=47917 RepID=UPI00217914B4|nr:glycosyltransferase [Serratia fonticola]CAI1714319.1 Glycosyl transferases group 1 [Serratia fonticola]